MARWMRMMLALLGALAATVVRAEAIRETDDTGQLVVLQQPAARIVSLAPNITELLFYLGAGERIVGADEYSNYPEAARAIPRVNNHATANYELILALDPDLVIGWQTGNGSIPDRVGALGLPVFRIEPRRLEDIPELFLRLGRLVGREQDTRTQAAAFRQRLAALRERQRGKTPVRVFYQVWGDPLITLNDEHLVGDVIRLCGGRNVFGAALPLVPYVSIESVLRADPEVIIAGEEGRQMWSAWPALPAVRNDLVFTIPADLMQRHSVRILDAAESLCGFLDQARAAAAVPTPAPQPTAP